ncbi:DUF3631 domain-containing protein [Aldersonia sp. NBC_00410]|uniref:DUF3631 domain-containing protein n=1 Tax=Aldersonia sp. NBC_00410 TaxID=2975954 RepID=UPI002251CA61|nr:DUF3631 domain-containing protein [Aldersonia sp. NBC_00410]MCX5044657.1 DUF3631 domain-containing protein [Aldersonia sp. NBC_00410]
MNGDSVPMRDSLARDIEHLILAGATYKDAPDIGSEVLDLIDAFAARFLSLSHDHSRHMFVLWAAHCWFMDAWNHTPRLLFVSPEAGCGKTTAMDVTEQLVPRPLSAADMSPASVYSCIDESMTYQGGRPTILLDELDAVFGNGKTRGSEDLRRLINAGHGCNEKVMRKINNKVKPFPVYGAMALAGKMSIYSVPETVRTRCTVVQMQKSLPGEESEPWDSFVNVPEAEPIRWMMRCWAELVHGDVLDYRGPGRPMIPAGIRNRDADIWRPLLVVAELAGGDWPERARVAAVADVAATGAQAIPSDGIDLLADIRATFDRLGVEVIHTTDLLAALATMDQRWRRLDGKRLARTLHDYGVTQANKNQRIGDKVTKGYRREYFATAWQRYLPPAATSATSATDEGSADE